MLFNRHLTRLVHGFSSKKTQINNSLTNIIKPCLIGSTPESKSSSLLSTAEALGVFRQLFLVEGKAESLGGATQSRSFTGGRLLLHSIRSSALLDLLFASNALTPRSKHHVSIESIHKLFPGADRADVAVTLLTSLLQQGGLNGLQLTIIAINQSLPSP